MTAENPPAEPDWAVLSARWPGVFDLKCPRALKIGIREEIIAQGLDAREAHRALRAYCSLARYQRCLTAGAVRIDLEGNPAGEVTAEQASHAKKVLSSKATATATATANATPSPVARQPLPAEAPLTQENIVPGRLELTIKFNELPKPVQVQAGYKFGLDCDGRPVIVTLKPKVWNKLAKAAADYPQWVAVLTGKMGPSEREGFVLLDPALQVFEKKPKAAAQEGATASEPLPPREANPLPVDSPAAAPVPPPAPVTAPSENSVKPIAQRPTLGLKKKTASSR